MRAAHETALLVLFALTCCDCSRTESSIPPSPSTHTPRVLPSLPLQVDLPSDAKVQPRASGVHILLHPGQRAPLGIDILRDDTRGSFLGTDTKTRALTPLLQLTYQEQKLPAEGSGGEEYVLDGLLTVASSTYRITCRQQSEWSWSPQTCLQILASLRSLSQDR